NIVKRNKSVLSFLMLTSASLIYGIDCAAWPFHLNLTIGHAGCESTYLFDAVDNWYQGKAPPN
ncbi:MAG: hypothetical protein WBQ59_24690, partial [Candidatus Acidiferrum sp.]